MPGNSSKAKHTSSNEKLNITCQEIKLCLSPSFFLSYSLEGKEEEGRSTGDSFSY